MREPASLLVGPAADGIRREIGPTAWTVLEVLVARADTAGDRVAAVANIRQTAAVLGLSKNAAHRAIRRLVETGLAVPSQQRGHDGRYRTGRYRLTIPSDVLTAVPSAEPLTAPTEPRLPARRRRSADHIGQLDLLVEAG